LTSLLLAEVVAHILPIMAAVVVLVELLNQLFIWLLLLMR
jgi:hypothetical protein